MTASPRALVAAIAGELRGRRRRIIARRWVLGALATGMSAMTLFTGAARDGRVSMAPPAGLSVVGGTTVVTGTRLLAPAADVLRLASADGIELTLDPSGSLTVIESGATRRFALMRGGVLAHVKKLGPGERFIVDTADAEVEVHGTIFRVELMAEPPPCGPSTTTRVSVTEGVVAVRGPAGRVLLFPGDEWPAACAPSPPASDGEGAEVPASDGGKRHRSATRRDIAPPHAAAPPASPASNATAQTALDTTALEAQNDLFSTALRAKRRGDTAGALALFDRFIRRYPDASLLEGALVQRMRLLAAADAQAGARAAGEYLARYPDGFARDEARRIARQTSGP